MRWAADGDERHVDCLNEVARILHDAAHEIQSATDRGVPHDLTGAIMGAIARLEFTRDELVVVWAYAQLTASALNAHANGQDAPPSLPPTPS